MRLYQFARDHRRCGSEVEALLLLALCRMRQGDVPLAFHTLEEAVVLAEAEKHVRVFLDEGAAMAELLAGWLKAGPARTDRKARQKHFQYAADLLELFQQAPRIRRPRPDALPPMAAALLTKREYEILRKIAEGATNENIAKELQLVYVGRS